MQAAVRPRSLNLLVLIGVVDLVATAVLHARGLIVEINPLMRPFIDRSEWQFAFIKGMTLALAWCVLSRYAGTHRRYVRNACLMGSAAYVGIWILGFLAGQLH